MSETKDKIDQNTEEEKNHEVAEEQSSASYEGVEREELIRQLEELKEQNGTFQEQLSEAKDAHLRKAAEFENFRKRVQRERSQIYESAKANALEDFLSISDDLSRTLEASNELEVNPTFLEGVTLVANKFDEVLEKHGVLRIDQEGVPFDVDLHDALMRRKPENESIESDRVLKVIENGYKIGDRTIRHAKVIVSE
jgi:molecular chaperone GrpE